ncbi:FAD-dependent thymidylate synthase [Thermoplasmatales archaeon AK]|nr:FAD-dependent thymidylate synthase [Thermoplasmatales archaeon AK]
MGDFSNSDRDVFILRIPRMIDRGALLSRYSRTSSLDLRSLYEKEFLTNEKRGEDFYRRVFLEYGDESVSELVTVQFAVQNVTNIASQVIEDSRIGLSFLEKSSRYVSYSRKFAGRYLYASSDRIGLNGSVAKDYEALCEDLFTFYSDNLEKAKKYYEDRYPLDSINFSETDHAKYIDELTPAEGEIAKKSYESAIRARALDDLRFLLPASTLTNIGISGNGRSLIYLVQRLEAYGTRETSVLADQIFAEMKPELPELIDAARNAHGRDGVKYLSNMYSEALHRPAVPAKKQLVELLDFQEEETALERSVGRLLTTFNGYDQDNSGSKSQLDLNIKRFLLDQIALRQNRRDRLHRIFELVNYTFLVNTNFGAFRDFHRHRFFTTLRGILTCSAGYDTPDYFLSGEELKMDYSRLMERAETVYTRIRETSGPLYAQYVVPFAYRYPVLASANLRELAHFIELRSTPQAHFDLRNIAIQMHDAIARVNPNLAKLIKFADRNQYALGRLKSEQRKERKMRNLEGQSGP